jgi:hypothetical protein
MYGSTKYGALGYTNIVDKIHHEKYKMLHSAQETGGPRNRRTTDDDATHGKPQHPNNNRITYTT